MPNKPIAVSFKTLIAKRIAAQLVEAGRVTVDSFASQTYKPDAAQRRAVGVANVGLSETEICKQRVGPVLIERIPQTPVALQANAGLFKTLTSKPIAEQQAEAEVANAALSANQTCKPCAVRRLGVAQANVDLYGIAICRRLVGR